MSPGSAPNWLTHRTPLACGMPGIRLGPAISPVTIGWYVAASTVRMVAAAAIRSATGGSSHHQRNRRRWRADPGGGAEGGGLPGPFPDVCSVMLTGHSTPVAVPSAGAYAAGC